MRACLEMRLKKRENLLRTLSCEKGGIDFASNDYLGLSRSVELREEIALAFAKCVHLGATGSRLLTGNSEHCEELESELANFFEAESALLFSSGYAANIGVMTALATRDDTILFDKLVHASLRDGIQLSHAKAYAWRHNDLHHLEEKLKRSPNAIVVAESLYSQDGSRAPNELSSVCAKYGATLILDEAHATGIFPPTPAFARIHTFGKAWGIAGAVVVGSHLLRKTLINFAKTFIYTTAMPSYQLSAIKATLRYLRKHPELNQRLHALLQFAKMETPIRMIPCSARAKAKELKSAGFSVSALLPPTVEKEGIRMALHAFNTEEEISQLCNLL